MSEPEVFDNTESMLLMAMMLDPKAKEDIAPEKIKEQKPGWDLYETEISSMLNIKDKLPSRSYTFDGLDKDRLFTTDASDLLSHPFDLIGEEKETILIYRDSSGRQIMKWMRYEEARRPNKLVPVSKVSKWFNVHYRWFDEYGNQDYVKTSQGFTSKGKCVPHKVKGWHNFPDNASSNAREATNMLAITCSIIEDAHRKGSMLAEVTGDASIIFPVQYGAHKDLLSIREGPRKTPTGRKNPILHFCKKHLRGTDSEVKSHWKGADEVTVDGLTLKLYAGDV